MRTSQLQDPTCEKGQETQGYANYVLVDPEVRDEVNPKHLACTTEVRPGDDGAEPDENTEVRNEDLSELVGGKQWLLRDKV